MEVFKSGRARGGRIIRTLATLLFSAILLGALIWVFMDDYSALETSNSSDSEDTPVAEEAAPSSVQEEVPELYYASEVEDALADAGLTLGSRNEASDDTAPAGVVIEQDPAAGSTVEEGTAVDIVVSTGLKQVPTLLRAAPASVDIGSPQAPATQAKSNSTSPAQAPATTKAAPQAGPISVESDSQQEVPAAQPASITAQTAQASSSVSAKTVQKKKK